MTNQGKLVIEYLITLINKFNFFYEQEVYLSNTVSFEV